MKQNEPIDLYRVLFFLSTTAAFCVAATSTLFWGNTSGLALYYLLLSTLAFAWSCYQLWTSARPAKISYGIASFTLAITAIAFFTRFKDLATIIPWCDEDWHNMRLLRSPNIIEMATWIHQPPLHYYFSKFSLLKISQTPFAIRLFPAIFASLSIPLFYSFLLKTCRKKSFAAFGSIALLSSIWLNSYAKEAKPYSAGVFFFLLFLHALYEFTQKPSWKKSISLTVTSLFSLLAIGLQPLILVFGALGLYLLYYTAIRQKEVIQKLLMVTIVSGLGFLPFQLNLLINNNSGFIKKLDVAAFLESGFLPSAKLTIAALKSLTMSGLSLFLPLLPLIFVFLFFFRPNEESAQRQRNFQITLTALAHLFPFVFLLLYGLVVNSPLMVRYLILFFPLYVAVIVYSFEALDHFFEVKLQSYRPYGANALIAVAGLLTLSYSYASSDDPSKKPMELKWDKFYRMIKNDDSSGALGFIFSLNLPQTFALDGFINADFYYTPYIKQKIKLNAQWDVFLKKTQVAQILERLDEPGKPSHVYFFGYNRENDEDFTKFRYSGDVKVIPVSEHANGSVGPWDATLVKIKNNTNVADTLRTFFTEMETQVKTPELKFKIYEVLAGIHLHRKDCQKAQQYFRKLTPCIKDEHRRGGLHLLCLNYEWLEAKLASCLAR